MRTLCVCAVLAAGSPALAQLDSLMMVRDATSARVSSAAPEDWSNRDNRWIPPGQAYTVAEIAGPGVIRHIWLTFAESKPGWLAKDGAAAPDEVVLRMYWDGAAEPAVEAPLGDFFAAGFGHRAEIISEPVVVQSGDAYNCWWPMPFAKSAKITVTNESAKPFSAFYYQVDYTHERALPPDAAYFCAQYRQEFPTVKGHDYLIADIEGRGHYVGTVMSVRSRSPMWFGEGDDKFYVDGDARPTMWGTGTEDYFLNAWGMEKGSFPSFGVTQLSGNMLDEVGVWGTMYRWHLADPVRFTRSLRVEIEHKGWMSADETSTGKVEGHVERDDDFATVAFWYQIGRPKRFATLPPLKERKLPEIDAVTEGKALLASAACVGGKMQLQAGDPWTGAGQVFFRGQEPGAWIESTFETGAVERRRLILALTHSYDYGIYRVMLDGKALGEPLDLYSPKIEVVEHALGDVTLEPGKHTLRLECTGKNAVSSGCMAGIDAVRLRQRWATKRPPLAPAPPAQK